MAYATSKDGIHWERPNLDVVAGTNQIVPEIVADSSTVWLDHFTKNPEERFKMFLRSPNSIPGSTERFNYGFSMVSPDGIIGESQSKPGHVETEVRCSTILSARNGYTVFGIQRT